MKKKIVLLLGCVMVVMMSACEKEGKAGIEQDGTINSEENIEREDEKKGEKQVKIPEEYEMEKENVVFKTKIHMDESARGNGIGQVSAIRQLYDTDKVYEQLFAGIELKNKSTSELSTNEGSTVLEYYYVGENEELLNLSVNKVLYKTAFLDYVYNCVDASAGGNIKSYAQDTDFSFATREEALQSIMAELEQMGIQLGKIEYQVYALDYQTMQQNEYAMDKDGNEDTGIYKDQWSEEDNCYYFFIRQKAGNLQEYHPYFDLFKKPIEENAPVKVVYSKNGIESLDIERVYDFDETEDELIVLKPFEEVAETVSYKYNQLLTKAGYMVTDATLYYMTENAGDGTYRMFPVWIFNVEETVEIDGEMTTDRLLMFVDAQTGEEIAMEDKY